MSRSPVARVSGLPITVDKNELIRKLGDLISRNLRDDEKVEIGTKIEIIQSCYDSQFSVALVDFSPRFPNFLSRLKNHGEWQTETDDGDWTFDSHFLGFTQLYDPINPNDILADIILLTGLDGHAYGSFRGRGDLGRMWPRHFLRKDSTLSRCRTMIYGYHSKLKSPGAHTILDYGRNFKNQLSQVRSTDKERRRRLIMGGHSFGGNIILHSLLDENNRGVPSDLFDSTYGLLFFGTPHKGLNITNLLNLKSISSYRIDLLNSVKPNAELLCDRLRRSKDIVHKFKVVSYYERLPTAAVIEDENTGEWSRKGDDQLSVPTNSALFDLPKFMENPIPLDKDHSDLVKYDSITDPAYMSVIKHLREYAADLPVSASREANRSFSA